MARAQFTLSVAQIQSLALKTMGFRGDHEVTIKNPYEDSTELEFDIYHVRVGIDHDGHWRAYSKDADDFADKLLGEGNEPALGRRSDGEGYLGLR